MVNRRLLKWSRELAYERPFDSFGCGHGSDLKEEVKREKEGKVKKKGWKMGNIIENMYITLLYVVHSMGLLCAYPNTSRRPMLLFGIGERERKHISNWILLYYICAPFNSFLSLALSPFPPFPYRALTLWFISYAAVSNLFLYYFVVFFCQTFYTMFII